MKYIFYLLLVGITFFTSCRNESTERQLINDAEALLISNPDSAYLLLDSITMADNLSDKLLARWCMLYGDVADKLHKDMPYVSQLLRARTWYEKHGTPYQQAQIGLYLGRSYVEDKEYMKAMDAYVQALDIAEKAKEYNVAGYISSYMGDLYEMKGFSSEALVKYHRASDNFLKAGNKRSYAISFRDMARTLVYQDSTSLALEYLFKADTIIRKLNDTEALASIQNGLGNTYAMLDDTVNAEYYYTKSLKTSSINNAPTYLALCNLYINKDVNKARNFLDKAKLSLGDNLYTSVAIIYKQYELEKNNDDTRLALFHLEQYQNALDSIYDLNTKNDILDIEKRYNHVILLNENNKLRNKNLIDAILLTVIIIVCMIVFVIYQYRNKLKNKKLYEQEIKLKQNDIRIYELSSELERMTNELSTQESIESNEKRLDQLKNNIVDIKNELTALKKEKLLTSPIVNKIIKLSMKIVPGKGSPLTDRDWLNLRNVINQTYGSFHDFVLNNEFGLTPAELQYCYLSFLELDIKSESVLLNINPESVSKRKLRIRQKLGSVGCNMPLYQYIING